MPRVSIGLPVWNGEEFLAETLASLLAQDFENLELLISDNGSTDATESLCRDAAARDERVHYHREPENRGAAWNYNAVLAMATAPLFKWAAADDVLAPTFVSSCVAALDGAGGAAVLAFPRTTLIDERSVVMSDLDDDDLDLRDPDPVRRFEKVLRHRVEWHPVFGVIRTDLLRRTPGIAPFPYADISLLAELSLLGQFHQVPERTFLRRYHEKRSIVAGPTFVQQVAWYDPRRRVRYAMPMTRLSKELMMVVGRADLPPAQKLRARSLVLSRWALPHWRQIGGEAKLAVRAIASTNDARSRIVA
jgi:glycosyltransferase involved in cell wall biosynthesis